MHIKNFILDSIVIAGISAFLIACFLYGTSKEVWDCDLTNITISSNK